MDMLDTFAVPGLEWISDKVEERYGRRVAWWATLAICLTVIAALCALIYILV